MQLAFGAGFHVPDTVTTAWGARWIFPADAVWDRQSNAGQDFEPLKAWLNSGALKKAADQARYCANLFFFPDSSELMILYRDAKGVIVGTPNRSYGYVYVAAWLHDGDVSKQPPAGTIDLTHKGNNKRKQRRSA